MRTFSVVKCGCAPDCYLVVRYLTGGTNTNEAGEVVHRFDTEAECRRYIESLP